MSRIRDVGEKKKYENENDWVGPKKTAPFLRKKGSFFGSQEAVTQNQKFLESLRFEVILFSFKLSCELEL